MLWFFMKLMFVLFVVSFVLYYLAYFAAIIAGVLVAAGVIGLAVRLIRGKKSA